MAHLSWKSWLSLAVAMSVIGTAVGIAALVGVHVFHVGNTVGDANLTESPVPEVLGVIFLYVLAINLSGALVLMALFAIVRRIRRN